MYVYTIHIELIEMQLIATLQGSELPIFLHPRVP